ncbi:MAG: cation transporter, partial [bacterium]
SPYEGLKGVKRFVGINKANVIGGSAFVGILVTNSLFLSTNVSYDWGQDRAADEPLAGIAPLQSTTRLTYDNTHKGYWFELVAKLAAAQNRYTERYGEIPTPGYVVFDCRGGFRVKAGVELSAGVKNIFNKYYRTHLNQALLPEPGRNVYASLRFTLPVSSLKKITLQSRNARKVNLAIEGMACEYCVKTVNERISALPGVVSTTVSLADKTARVIIQENKLSLDELIDVIERAGFQAALISVESFKKDQE